MYACEFLASFQEKDASRMFHLMGQLCATVGEIVLFLGYGKERPPNVHCASKT